MINETQLSLTHFKCRLCDKLNKINLKDDMPLFQCSCSQERQATLPTLKQNGVKLMHWKKCKSEEGCEIGEIVENAVPFCTSCRKRTPLNSLRQIQSHEQNNDLKPIQKPLKIQKIFNTRKQSKDKIELTKLNQPDDLNLQEDYDNKLKLIISKIGDKRQNQIITQLKKLDFNHDIHQYCTSIWENIEEKIITIHKHTLVQVHKKNKLAKIHLEQSCGGITQQLIQKQFNEYDPADICKKCRSKFITEGIMFQYPHLMDSKPFDSDNEEQHEGSD